VGVLSCQWCPQTGKCEPEFVNPTCGAPVLEGAQCPTKKRQVDNDVGDCVCEADSSPSPDTSNSTTTTPTPVQSSTPDNNNTPLIIGLAAGGCLCLFGLLAALIFCVLQSKKNRNDNSSEPSGTEMSDVMRPMSSEYRTMPMSSENGVSSVYDDMPMSKQYGDVPVSSPESIYNEMQLASPSHYETIHLTPRDNEPNNPLSQYGGMPSRDDASSVENQYTAPPAHVGHYAPPPSGPDHYTVPQKNPDN